MASNGTTRRGRSRPAPAPAGDGFTLRYSASAGMKLEVSPAMLRRVRRLTAVLLSSGVLGTATTVWAMDRDDPPPAPASAGHAAGEPEMRVCTSGQCLCPR